MMDGKTGLTPYLGLWMFGLAFGLIEAAVVMYLRLISGVTGEDLFPVLQAMDETQKSVFSVERFREAATLILMLTPAFLFSNRNFERMLAYGIVFGTWDMSYYGFLWVFLGWPASLFSYDVLFLIPTLWVAPVFCPLLISVSLVVFGSAYFLSARRRVARNPSAPQWLIALLGGALVLLSFVNHADYYLAGGMPPRFSWLIFVSGYFLAALSGVHFLVQFVQQPKTRFF
jgi:hypothetical protein